MSDSKVKGFECGFMVRVEGDTLSTDLLPVENTDDISSFDLDTDEGKEDFAKACFVRTVAAWAAHKVKEKLNESDDLAATTSAMLEELGED